MYWKTRSVSSFIFTFYLPSFLALHPVSYFFHPSHFVEEAVPSKDSI